MSDAAKATPVPDWGRPGARCTMSIEPAVAMRATAFDWDYEVQVALPASYRVMPEKRYPVVWLTDGPFLLHLDCWLTQCSGHRRSGAGDDHRRCWLHQRCGG